MSEQVTREQLKNMTPSEITKAHKDGRLSEITDPENTPAPTGYRANGQHPRHKPHDMRDFIASREKAS